MNFINLIRIQFIFGIEDQLILSYNPLTISDSLDFMRHFVPLKSVPYLTGSIPLISTTYLIHHICPMWFFLFIPLTAISDSLDFMRHFVPLKSVPYLIFGPAYQCRNVKGTILYLYDSIVPFYFPWYRPKSLF